MVRFVCDGLLVPKQIENESVADPDQQWSFVDIISAAISYFFFSSFSGMSVRRRLPSSELCSWRGVCTSVKMRVFPPFFCWQCFRFCRLASTVVVPWNFSRVLLDVWMLHAVNPCILMSTHASVYHAAIWKYSTSHVLPIPFSSIFFNSIFPSLFRDHIVFIGFLVLGVVFFSTSSSSLYFLCFVLFLLQNRHFERLALQVHSSLLPTFLVVLFS